MSSKTVVRFAPSPTGNLHIGSARTALFNYLFSRHEGGSFILRIEDTDTERSTREYEKNILDSLQWLDIPHDEFYRQSERADVYRKHLENVIAQGKAYLSREAAHGDPGREIDVVRLKNPGRVVEFIDEVRGKVSFDTTELGDFVVAKTIDTPLYHFAVVVDDHEMAITHVIRGEDHISNTPRQILIQEAIGAVRPIYVHIPLILAPDRSKLSKRHGATAVTEYRDTGYLPDAIVNYLALLGWSPGNDREVLTREELNESFSLAGIQKSGAIFNLDKLRWLNREHLKRLSFDDFLKGVRNYLPIDLVTNERVEREVGEMLRERVATWGDVTRLAREGEFDFFTKDPVIDIHGLTQNETHDIEDVRQHLASVATLWGNIPENEFNRMSILKAMSDYATEHGRAVVLWPLRYALTGKEKSPDPFTVASIIGKMTTLRRIQKAVNL